MIVEIYKSDIKVMLNSLLKVSLGFLYTNFEEKENIIFSTHKRMNTSLKLEV